MCRICLVILFISVSSGLFAQAKRGNATDEYIGFYQQILSNQKNSRCAMYPSCSNYGKMVFGDRPFVEAITLLTDRIMRCSHEQKFYDVTYQYGYRSAVDYPYYKDIPDNIIHNAYRLPHTDCFKRNSSNDSILLFINHLINKEEYRSAIIEIERSIFQNQNSNPILFAHKLLCYRGLNEFEKGIFEYETEYPKTVKKIDKVNVQAALLYYSTADYNNVINVLSDVGDEKRETDEWQKSYLLKGIIKAQQKDFQEAENLFRGAVFLQNDVSRYERNLNIVRQMQKQRKKSPVVAKMLSIIPGGGYLYTNHKGSALTALIVNSLLGYATYTSVKSKNYGMAGVCGFLGLSFYIGNINGAGRSAVRYNERMHKMYIQELENNNHIFIN